MPTYVICPHCGRVWQKDGLVFIYHSKGKKLPEKRQPVIRIPKRRKGERGEWIKCVCENYLRVK